MTGVEFKSYLRDYLTKTDSVTFTDADVVLLANTVKNEMASRINRANRDIFGMIYTTDLVSNQREYPLPADLLRTVKRVEAKFDNVNWIPLNEMDINNYERTTDETTIIGQFSNDKGGCFYDIFRDSLFIYSGTIGNVTGGLKLWGMVYPEDIVAGTLALTSDLSVPTVADRRTMPREFHKLWCEGVSIEYKSSKDRQTQLTLNEQKWEARFNEMLAGLKNNNLDRKTIMTVPGTNFNQINNYDHGYNL